MAHLPINAIDGKNEGPRIIDVEWVHLMSNIKAQNFSITFYDLIIWKKFVPSQTPLDYIVFGLSFSYQR